MTASTPAATISASTRRSHISRIVTAFDDRKALLKRAIEIVAATEVGLSLQDIADGLAESAAKRAFPAADEQRIAVLAKAPTSQGGFAVAKQTVANYVNAYDILARTAIEADATTFGIAKRFVDRNSTAATREAIVTALNGVAVGKRPEALVTATSDALAGIKAKAQATKAAAKTSTDGAVETRSGVMVTASDAAAARPKPIGAQGKGADVTTATTGVTPVSLEVALATIRALAVQTWSPAQGAKVAAALLDAAALIEAGASELVSA